MRFIRADEASCTQYGRNSTGKEKVAARAPHVESETHTTTMPPKNKKKSEPPMLNKKMCHRGNKKN